MYCTFILALLISNPVRIAVLGDRTGSPDDAEYARAVEAIASMSPDLILTVGDFVEGYGDSSAAVEDWNRIEPFLDLLESSCTGVIYTPGNNDIWDEASLEIWIDRIGRDPSRIERACGIAFLVWDTSRFDLLSDEHLDELENLTGQIDAGEPWILVTHKPFWFMADQDKPVLARFDSLMRHTAPLAVVGGHIHLFAAERRDGILYVSAGSSGSAVPSPDPDRGKFTQLGWMTVYADSVAYTALDARGVYPEELNTGQEQLLAFLYQRDMIRASALDPAVETAELTLYPVENVERRIRMSVDPGCWGLTPDSTEILLDQSPIEVHFTRSGSSGFYPLPVVTLGLLYGDRDKELEFDFTWPLLRRADAVPGSPRVDGSRGEEEYPGAWQSDFADLSGEAASAGLLEFAVMASGDGLYLLADMSDREGVDPDMESDCLGIVIESHGTFYWLKVLRNGDTSSRIITPDWEFEEWYGGYETSIRESATGWNLEVRFDREELTLDGDGAGAHVYRVHDQGCSTWAWPLEFDRSTMGELRFEQATTE